MDGRGPYFPNPGHAADPSPDGEVWPICLHPKTPANTQKIGKDRVRCRLCRRKITRESNRRRRDKDRVRPNG